MVIGKSLAVVKTMAGIVKRAPPLPKNKVGGFEELPRWGAQFCEDGLFFMLKNHWLGEKKIEITLPVVVD